ncbi:MAG: dihydroneopterin aldolase family protein [Methanolinea sp.]|nr:dihydroneopterin aldolase family protein [Methanolinea sp.]
MVTARERAILEAGIKLGALYHQWVGSPVSPGTAGSLERAIEESVGLQPFVEEIHVWLDRGLMSPNAFGYSELSGLMLNVDITTRVEGACCRARLRREGDYPLMEIVE